MTTSCVFGQRQESGVSRTLWGLPPETFVDLFWGRRGVQLVAPGTSSPIQHQAELFLLVPAGKLVLFSPLKVFERFAWISPAILCLRLHAGGSVTRVGVTEDRSMAESWRTCDTVNNWLDLHPGDPGYDPYYSQNISGLSPATVTTSVPKRLGHIKGITTTILILDSDQDSSTNTDPKQNTNNWPDPHNNHGIAGLNMGFADGHVSFVSRGPNLIRTYLQSYGGPGINLVRLQQIYPGITEVPATASSPARWVLPK